MFSFSLYYGIVGENNLKKNKQWWMSSMIEIFCKNQAYGKKTWAQIIGCSKGFKNVSEKNMVFINEI